MIVLFRSSWHKYHTSFRFYRWIFVTSNYIFQVFTCKHHTSLFECGHLITGIINFNLLVPKQYRRYFAKFYAYSDSDPTAMLRAPWTTSPRRHGALGVPPATLRRVCFDATATCFRDDLTALVLSMFKTWRRPRRPWRPYCHGALWYLTTTLRRSAAIWPILQIAVRSPSCVTGVLVHMHQGQVTHICVRNQGSDNGLSPFRCQTIL